MLGKTRNHLCLVALVSLGAFLGTGCHHKDSAPPPPPPPVLESNSKLVTLGVSAGILSPAFSPDVHDYTIALYSAEPSITVSPAVSTKATVKVDSVAVPSGQASGAIALVAGTPKVISVQVQAEDRSQGNYTLTVTENLSNTDVWVLDSSNGSPVAGTNLQVMDATGKPLQDGIPVDSTGHASLGLPTDGTKFGIFAMAPGSAQASRINFDRSKDTGAYLYCHSLGMINFPAVAPQITQLSYSADGVTWVPVTGNQISDSLANIAAIKVTAIAKCGISPTAWSGFGIGLQVDKTPWTYDWLSAYETSENSKLVTIGGLPYYQTTASFGIPLTNATAGDAHVVDVVVYDVANNRTEQKIYLTVTDATAAGADVDLSAFTPANVNLQLSTFGLTRDFYSMGGNVTYQALLQFNVGSGATAPGLRGYEIWRSTDGTTFTKVSTTHFGSLFKGTSGQYTYLDNDPSLALDTTYTYKVCGFAATITPGTRNYTAFSPTLSAKFLAPHTVNLAAPASDTISMTRKPTFRFIISAPALFDPAVSDYYRFLLYIKDKVGNGAYNVAYRYNWLFTPVVGQPAVPRFERNAGTSSSPNWIDATSEVSISVDKLSISIQLPASFPGLVPSMTYEWNIYGTTANANAPYFLKYFSPAPATNALSLSYGSTYEKTYGAINGYFTLIIDPAAN